MITKELTIPVGGSQMPAYLARPEEGSGAHAAVIVLQEVFGFTPETKRVTDLIAGVGYVGLAVNYYHRTRPEFSEPYDDEGSARAFAVAAEVSKESLKADVAAASAWLERQPFVKPGKIATWGFGFGATAAFICASLPQTCAAVCFYPGHITKPMPSGDAAPVNDVADIRVPLLMCFGAQDYYVSRHDMDEILRALTGAQKEFRVQIYPNVGHSFFRHGRPEAIVEHHRYSDESIAQAVADSWDLVKAFLRDAFSRVQSPAAASAGTRK